MKRFINLSFSLTSFNKRSSSFYLVVCILYLVSITFHLGNGYVFLLLHRLTREDKHLRRARQFAAFMQTEEFKANSRVPDAPYSLFEGIAGTACFLADLVNPDEGFPGMFPFMDIF